MTGKQFVIIVPGENAIGPFPSYEEAQTSAVKFEKALVLELKSSFKNKQMDATYRKEKSFHGHSLDVLKSGLQKYIRRGETEKAMYCLAELDLFSECSGGERIRTNMIHRLMIIFMEDICLGGVESWARADELVFGWLKDRKKTFLIQELVQLMCKSKKTRACSFARCFSSSISNDEEPFELQIKNKNWTSIKTLLSLLNQKSSLKEYRDVCKIMSRSGVQNMDIALRWIREVKTAERPLFFLLPLLHHIFGGYSMEENIPIKLDENWSTHRNLPVLEFDEYVFDKHTQRGNRDRGFFVNVSSQVNNEVFILPECFAQKYYRKEEPVAVALETSYEFVVRCQLVTSKTKTDTVIARNNGKLVFLKGPYKTDTSAKFFLKMQDEKRKRNIPGVNGRIVYLKPNRWNQTPLGVRNSLDLSMEWPFLETEVLFEEEKMQFKTVKSKLWPETKVLDCEAMQLTIDPFTLSDTQLEDYISAIKFRKEFQIGDFADRNFLLGKDGRVYSVDEESASKSPIDLEKQLKKNRFSLFTKHSK